MKKIIAITGGIASGKSTVTDILREKGYPIADTDKIAREMAEPQQPLWLAYTKRYGDKILQADGNLNRRAIADIVFSQPREKQWMDAMAHPLIKEEVRRQIKEFSQQGHSLIFLDVPLLFEAGWENMAEEIWLVYVDEATQLARLCSRNGYSREEAARRIAAQMPLAEKKQRADKIIDNSGSLAALHKQVAKLLREEGRR